MQDEVITCLWATKQKLVLERNYSDSEIWKKIMVQLCIAPESKNDFSDLVSILDKIKLD